MSGRAVWLAILLSIPAMPTPSRADAADASLQAAKLAAESAMRADSHPREAFLQEPERSDVSMSPDGRWLTWRWNDGAQVQLWLGEIDTDERHRVLSDGRNTAVHWSADGKRIWLADDQGLGVFDIGSLSGRRIVRFDPARRQSFLGVDRNAADSALLREQVRDDGDWLYRYLAVDASGKTQPIHQSHMPLQGMLLNPDGSLRYAAGHGKDTGYDTVLWRFGAGPDGNGREEIMRCPLPQRCRLVAWHADTLWVLAQHGTHDSADRISLQQRDAASGQWRLLHSDPRAIADAVAVLMQPDGKDWLALAYRPDRIEWHGRDAMASTMLARLQKHLPDANLAIDASNDGTRWLVQARQANWPCDRHYLYDPHTAALVPAFATDRCSALASDQLAKAIAVQWRGIDGMRLHGYAYLPNGVPLQSAPLIALLHGGPYNRSNGEYDVAAQLLVNRGYIVFEPNFRASTGLGVRYLTAAKGNFGRHGVLDDIISGLDHLIANGIGDSDQQAVIGHSFGGYASLLAVTHHPDRFAFAVPLAAPVDFAWTMAEIAVEGGSALSADGPPIEIVLTGHGVPYRDPAWHERMHRDAPLAHAAKLRTPVYLWAGARDDRVAVESLVRYVADASAASRPVLLIDPDAGHSPRDRSNREALAWLIEASANAHFGGGVSPPSSSLKRFLQKNLRAGPTERLLK